MQYQAFISGGVVVGTACAVDDETVTIVPPAGSSVISVTVAQYASISSGQIATETAGVWSFAPAPAPATTTMSALDWYDCFTIAEAIAIKASTDPRVQEFLYRLQQWIAAGKMIDTSTTSIQEGVNYLAATNQIPAVSPPAPYIAAGRAAQILAGVRQ